MSRSCCCARVNVASSLPPTRSPSELCPTTHFPALISGGLRFPSTSNLCDSWKRTPTASQSPLTVGYHRHDPWPDLCPAPWGEICSQRRDFLTQGPIREADNHRLVRYLRAPLRLRQESTATQTNPFGELHQGPVL